MNRFLRLSTGLLLVVGISLASATSGLTLRAKFHDVSQDMLAGRGAEITTLHGAALPLSSIQEETSRLLLAGMVMILAALFLYGTYVIRTQHKPHSRWQRFVRWFQEQMDIRPPRRRNTHVF